MSRISTARFSLRVRSGAATLRAFRPNMMFSATFRCGNSA